MHRVSSSAGSVNQPRRNHHPKRTGQKVHAVRKIEGSPRGTQRTRHPTQIHRGPPDQNENTAHSQ